MAEEFLFVDNIFVTYKFDSLVISHVEHINGIINQINIDK